MAWWIVNYKQKNIYSSNVNIKIQSQPGNRYFSQTHEKKIINENSRLF